MFGKVFTVGVETILGRLNSEPFITALLGLVFVLIGYGMRRLNSVSPLTESQPIQRTNSRHRHVSDLRLSDVPPAGIEIPEQIGLS